METKFNFNSAICTSREQSERLLKLGLKKETADMCHRTSNGYNSYVTAWDILQQHDDIPAWSLHRLIEMMPKRFEAKGHVGNVYFYYVRCIDEIVGYGREDNSGYPIVEFHGQNSYGHFINCIEWLIKEGYFSKEYLE